jgi:hypothetical protein
MSYVLVGKSYRSVNRKTHIQFHIQFEKVGLGVADELRPISEA